MCKNCLQILLVVFIGVMAQNSWGDTPMPYRDNFDGSRTLAGHVPAEVASSKIHHHANANEQLNLRVMVPLANQAQLDEVLKGLYDSTSPIYHHFLTSAQFNQQFRASDADLTQLKNYFSSKGFAVNSQSSNGTVLNLTASVGAVENAFGVHINYYTKNDGTMFFAPDADPTIAAEIVGKVSAVAGMDNVVKFKPHFNQFIPKPVSQGVGGTQVATPNMVGTGPGGYLAPSDVKTAYNLNSIPSINDPSSLQNVALFELDGYLQSDITNYETYFGLPTNSVALQNVLIDGFNGVPTFTGGNYEVTLDVEELIGIAPWSINKIYVYEAPNSFQAWDDEWTKIANDNIAKIISCSWGVAEYYSPTISFDNQIFQQMAAQGQEVFVASGDCGAYADCSSSTLSTDEPAAQPYATGVGISALSVNTNGTYKSETASLGGGGGISLFNKIPSYQVAMAKAAQSAAMVSQTMRNVPDVALTADSSTPYAFYISTTATFGGWYGFWGSSIAAPTWAAFIAQVNQGRVHSGQAIIGFLNPVIYPMAANSSQYANDFHDIVTGNNQYYPAEIGFSDATGLGSFNGANLYNDLVNPASTVIPSAPTGLSAVAGPYQATLSWNLSLGAASYNVKRSTVNGGPYQNVNTSPVVGTSFVDASVSASSVYYYVVSAVNTAGQSANSTQVSVTPLPAAPAEPTGLQALPGNNQVTFSWSLSSGATSYNVRRSTVSEGPWTVLASGVITTSYVDKTALNGNMYYYTVSAVNAGGESPYINQFVITLMPSAPTGVLAAPGNNQVALSWSASSGAVSYNVKRSTTSSGTYTTISTSGAVTTTGYTDKTVVNGQAYFYVVSAVDAGGEGLNSTQVTATPLSQVPAVPTGLSAVGGNNQVALTWTASSGATSYNVQRSMVSNASFVTVATVSSPKYTDTALSNGYPYYYEVNAVNAGGQSANTSEVYAIPAGLPVAPTTVIATAGNGQASVAFSGFSANGSVITGFTVTSSPGALTAKGSSSPVIVSGLTNGVAYTFSVVVTNGVGSSSSAASNSVIPLAPAPPAPTGLQGAGGNNQVTLSWTASKGAGSYNVKRASALNGPFTVLKSSVTSTSYVDAPLQNGTSYFYVVTAVNTGSAESANSNEIMVVPLAPIAAPTGLTAVAGSGSITLSWNAIQGTEFYYVGRSTSSTGPFFLVSTTTNGYKDTAVTYGVTYYYDVQAYVMVNGTGELSSVSLPVKATPLVPAASVPTGLWALIGNNQLSLYWNVSSGATSYNVKRSTSSSGTYTTIATVATTNYVDKTVTNGTTYFYEVSAVNAGGESANSSAVGATPVAPPPPPPAAPTGLTALPGANQVTLNWNATSGATSYIVLRLYDWNVGFVTIATGITSPKYVDNNALLNGGTYY